MSNELQLACDCCGAPMERNGFQFNCTKCDQVHGFESDGSGWCVIIARLYPAWDHMPSAMKREAVAYTVKQRKFLLKARLILEIITPSDYENKCDALDEAEKEKLATIVDDPPAPPPPPQAWLDRIRGWFR